MHLYLAKTLHSSQWMWVVFFYKGFTSTFLDVFFYLMGISKYSSCNKPLQFHFTCAWGLCAVTVPFLGKTLDILCLFCTQKYGSFGSSDAVTNCGSHLLMPVWNSASVLFAFPLTVLSFHVITSTSFAQCQHRQNRHKGGNGNVGDNVDKSFVPSSMIAWLMYHFSLVLHFHCGWWVIM